MPLHPRRRFCRPAKPLMRGFGRKHSPNARSTRPAHSSGASARGEVRARTGRLPLRSRRLPVCAGPVSPPRPGGGSLPAGSAPASGPSDRGCPPRPAALSRGVDRARESALPMAAPCQRRAAGSSSTARAGRKCTLSPKRAIRPGGRRAGSSPKSARSPDGIGSQGAWAAGRSPCRSSGWPDGYSPGRAAVAPVSLVPSAPGLRKQATKKPWAAEASPSTRRQPSQPGRSGGAKTKPGKAGSGSGASPR